MYMFMYALRVFLLYIHYMHIIMYMWFIFFSLCVCEADADENILFPIKYYSSPTNGIDIFKYTYIIISKVSNLSLVRF